VAARRHHLAGPRAHAPTVIPTIGRTAKLQTLEAQMEKRTRGEIRVHERLRDGDLTFSLRFRVDGKREIITLGRSSEGWTWHKAERKLENVLARVRAGVWEPELPPNWNQVGDLTFHEFAPRWWAARKAELRHNTQLDYEWRLKRHLLPFFAELRVAEINIDVVDRYREQKLIERETVRRAAASGNPLLDKRGQRRVALCNESINKTLALLAQILDSAVERGGLETNPARGKRRRLKATRPVRRVLEPDELAEMLAVAGRIDRQKRRDLQIGPPADDRGDGQDGIASHGALPNEVAGG
jgi:hypothetical protein